MDDVKHDEHEDAPPQRDTEDAEAPAAKDLPPASTDSDSDSDHDEALGNTGDPAAL